LLKEEMEYGRPVTDDQIEEERKKIVDMIKVMETDGKIAFRQKGKTNALSGDEISSQMSGMKLGAIANAGQVDPQAAQEAYNAGVAAGEQGNAEESIRQLDIAVKQDPSLAPAHQALANAYYAQGRYQEALKEYDAYLQLSPDEGLSAWVEELRASIAAAA
jgi:tetratricopeptide (TPR) repeat protein